MNKDRLLIGSHVSANAPDYLLDAVKTSIGYGASTFMFYTGAPQNTKRVPIDLFKMNEAKELMETHQINLNDLVVHAPYIINPCSSKPSVRQLANEFLLSEIKRVHYLGIKYIVLHPGSRLNQEVDVAINQIATAINDIFDSYPCDVVVCLETMSGKGTEVGSRLEELAMIIDQVKHKNNIGVCLDTCHIHDAGYDISVDNFDQFLTNFDRIIGLSYLKVIHINDSKNVINAHKDRHENIGYGHIGFDALNYIVHHPKLVSIPKILETPWYTNQNNKELPLYFDEINMFKNQAWFDSKKKNDQ
ncbi:deoxyribonuclease IV [Ureaplasma canigenitalium]|uniref:deoxyribonuclease IV n=1 Tax=Ureaplasma canigenitalium TaxID=42092 RepID=UPI0004E0CC03|nr:deoxyribonuclease IV [Ureaplasma canigenitalium]